MKPRHAVDNRWQIACCNWGIPCAPHAMAYLKDSAGNMVGDPAFFDSQPEALAFARRYIGIVRKFIAEAGGAA